MASPLLGLAATINKALGPIFFDAVLTRYEVPASPAYESEDPPAAVPVNYTCKALRDNYSRHDRSDSSILAGDAKLLILANSLSTSPMKDDVLTITGQGRGFTVIEFNIDPANACWTIQGRQ